MRALVVATATVVAVALTSGCAGDGTDSPTPRDRESPTTPSPGSGDAVIDSAACEKVRAGIDAFNQGRYDETVEHFKAAVPLAEEQNDNSVPAGQLVAAVRYYAELDPELYPDAARSSPEFALHKAITLGQCVAAGEESPESPGTEV